MTIFVSSTADLLTSINTASGVTFLPGEIIFGNPRDTTPAEKTKFGKNTRVAFKVADTSTKATGFTAVYYDRLDIQYLNLMNLYGTLVPADAPMSAWFPVAIGFMNIGITLAELVDHPSVTVNNKVRCIMEVAPGNLGWFGTATLNFPGLPDIATAFNTNILSGF